MADFCTNCAKSMGFERPDIDIAEVLSDLPNGMMECHLCEGCGDFWIGKDDDGNPFRQGDFDETRKPYDPDFDYMAEYESLLQEEIKNKRNESPIMEPEINTTEIANLTAKVDALQAQLTEFYLSPVNIPVELVDGGTMPSKVHQNDIGWDLTIREMIYEPMYVECFLGVKVAIPVGYVGLIFPRSSFSKTDYALTNSVGVIDPDYRGELRARIRRQYIMAQNYGKHVTNILVGDRAFQLVILRKPNDTLIQVPAGSLGTTERGEGGFGSTGI